jgi:ribosomal protein S12 methylthiotransferase accessory factor
MPSQGRWSFGPTAKVEGERSVPFGETLRRARAAMPLVPVTRVSDLTPLDTVGVPVFAATTPLALDLTVNMGKGVTRDAARLSAIMEGIERVTAERPPPESTVRASYRELRARGGPVEPLDARIFDLPDDTEYADDGVFTWTLGHDLLREKEVWAPADVVVTPPAERILRHSDTNGVASGNVLLEGVVHGICELVERDVLSQYEFCQAFGDVGDQLRMRSVRVETLPAIAQEMAKRIYDSGQELSVSEVSQDIRVPTFWATITDRAFPSLEGSKVARFPGFGTHPNATVAVLRSMTEAIQSRVSAIAGSRDSFNTVGVSRFRPAFVTYLANTLGADWMAPRLAFDDVPSYPTRDVLHDLSFLLDRLRASGFARCLAFDLTNDRFTIPVVRVRIPGIAMFWANKRRIGWRCRQHLL